MFEENIIKGGIKRRMINIKNLKKKYGNKVVLDNINIDFPRFGLFAICGDSGCGKTTLLNCLSSLLEYEGKIEIDGVDLSSLNEEDKDLYRLKHIGFVFQDFKLFNSETVERNILLPLDMSNNMKGQLKERKILDLLDVVKLEKYRNQKVDLLSGGEKQRIAIARALVNDPKIVLADEPTGALDSENSKNIMDILLSISKRALVIVVSHDEELMKKYASKIIYMKDGKISSSLYPKREERNAYLPIFQNKESNKKPSIPSSYLLRHSLYSMKQKKGRTIISNIVTSLGLIGVGLAISLSSSISSNIKNAYSSMIDEEKIIMTYKDENHYSSLMSGGYYDAMNIASKFINYVNDVGVTYYVDFENYFKDKNEFAIASTTYRSVINNLSTRNINEFKWLDYEIVPQIYPRPVKDLKDDEVIFGLTLEMIEDICFSLRIERSISSLSKYLEDNEFLIYLDAANYDWCYYDQELFTLKGFTLEREPCIYHYNHLWNEHIFETLMRLPSNDNLSKKDYYPWVMKKVVYFQTNRNTDEFLIEAENSELLDEYILEIANEKYYPWLYKKVDVKDRHRVLLFVNTYKSIPKRYANILIEENNTLNSPIYGTSGGYAFYPSNMLSGFSHQTFFSFSEELIDKVVDENTSLNLNSNEYTVLKQGVMVGHFSKTMNESVRFAAINDKKLIGSSPHSLDEIVISTGLAKELSGEDNMINKTLLLSYNEKESILSDGSLKRTFINSQLRVCGLVQSEKYEIYHYPYWTTNFFKSRLGVSAFDLLVNSIAFNSEDTSEKTIDKIHKAFPKYTVTNPMDSVNDSIDQVCSYIEIAMTIFSIVATIIASLLLTMCAYLHIIDSQKEIALSRCLGISKKESRKFVIYHTVISCVISLIIAIIEIVIISLFASFAVANSLNSKMIFVFDFRGIFFMTIIVFFIAFISSIWASNKVTKINPIEVLKK